MVVTCSNLVALPALSVRSNVQVQPLLFTVKLPRQGSVFMESVEAKKNLPFCELKTEPPWKGWPKLKPSKQEANWPPSRSMWLEALTCEDEVRPSLVVMTWPSHSPARELKNDETLGELVFVEVVDEPE